MLFAFSLHEEILEDEDNQGVHKGTDVQIKSTIEKKVSNNNILQHLMKRGFNINSNALALINLSFIDEDIINLDHSSYIEAKNNNSLQIEELNP